MFLFPSAMHLHSSTINVISNRIFTFFASKIQENQINKLKEYFIHTVKHALFSLIGLIICAFGKSIFFLSSLSQQLLMCVNRPFFPYGGGRGGGELTLLSLIQCLSSYLISLISLVLTVLGADEKIRKNCSHC